MPRCRGKTVGGRTCIKTVPKGVMYCALHCAANTSLPDEVVDNMVFDLPELSELTELSELSELPELPAADPDPVPVPVPQTDTPRPRLKYRKREVAIGEPEPKPSKPPKNSRMRVRKGTLTRARLVLYNRLKKDENFILELREKLRRADLMLTRNGKEIENLPWELIKYYSDIKFEALNDDERYDIIDDVMKV